MIFEFLKLITICFVLSDMGKFIAEVLYEALKAQKNMLIRFILSFLTYVLNCDKCFSFWFSLFMTGDLFIACCVSFIVNISKVVEYKLKGKTEL